MLTSGLIGASTLTSQLVILTVQVTLITDIAISTLDSTFRLLEVLTVLGVIISAAPVAQVQAIALHAYRLLTWHKDLALAILHSLTIHHARLIINAYLIAHLTSTLKSVRPLPAHTRILRV